MSEAARHITFTGRVQGVGFRFTALRTAARFGLVGFVRNLPNGGVEMVAQGSPGDIEQCIRDIEETLTGYITETKIEKITPDLKYKNFKITF